MDIYDYCARQKKIMYEQWHDKLGNFYPPEQKIGGDYE